ncbi:MAG TPA: acyl-CoA dehydrogenase family protein, partial [Mycobacterium sp.]|nr:acyl-CoA dehydrogenase family protein [Mycobacterium sp.]
MSHYRANVRDLEFNLFEVLDIEKVLSSGEFGGLTPDAVRDIVHDAATEAEGPLARAFADGDRQHPTFDPQTHSVALPES